MSTIPRSPDQGFVAATRKSRGRLVLRPREPTPPRIPAWMNLCRYRKGGWLGLPHDPTPEKPASEARDPGAKKAPQARRSDRYKEEFSNQHPPDTEETQSAISFRAEISRAKASSQRIFSAPCQPQAARYSAVQVFCSRSRIRSLAMGNGER